jgi:hypothetical protein
VLQFNQWNKTTIQVGLEGAVFIYVHRLPFAVRAAKERETFINTAMCQAGTPALEAMEKMTLMTWSLTKLPPDQFREKVRQIYANAVLDGARRIGLECIKLAKEQENVDNEQNGSGHIKDRNAWNRRTGSEPV